MKRVERVVANTFVDSQNDRMTRGALEGLVDSISRHIVPIGVEHDPRVPPIGRVVSGFVRDRSDGESEAVIVFEVFEPGDDLASPEDDTRVLVIHDDLKLGSLEISYDYSYRNDEALVDIREIADVLGCAPDYELKKSADPISILTLAGAFALAGIATGFLNAVGTEGWNRIKPLLASLVAREKSSTGDQLLVLRAVITDHNGSPVEVETILTNPTARQIDDALSAGLETVDSLVCAALESTADVRKLVLSSDGQNVRLEFGVRKDGAPLAFKASRRRGH